MGKFKNYHNIFTTDWETSSNSCDLEEQQISAILTISKNKMPPMTLEFYTILKIQHYSASIADLKDDALEAAAIRIARIIYHFVENNQRILIRSHEDSGVAFAMVFYSIWSYYHNSDGSKKEGIKKPEISITAKTIAEIKSHRIETDLDIYLIQKLHTFENRYAGLSS